MLHVFTGEMDIVQAAADAKTTLDSLSRRLKERSQQEDTAHHVALKAKQMHQVGEAIYQQCKRESQRVMNNIRARTRYYNKVVQKKGGAKAGAKKMAKKAGEKTAAMKKKPAAATPAAAAPAAAAPEAAAPVVELLQ